MNNGRVFCSWNKKSFNLLKFILMWLKKLDTYWKTNPNQKITNNQILKTEWRWRESSNSHLPKALASLQIVNSYSARTQRPSPSTKNTTKLTAFKLTPECNRCTRESSSSPMTLGKITKVQRNLHSPNFNFSLIPWNVVCQLACHCKSDSSKKAQ